MGHYDEQYAMDDEINRQKRLLQNRRSTEKLEQKLDEITTLIYHECATTRILREALEEFKGRFVVWQHQVGVLVKETESPMIKLSEPPPK